MDYQQLKRFAVRSRERLIAKCGENTAYLAFMRLGALAHADYAAFAELMEAPAELRPQLFTAECSALAGKYGGIFSYGGRLVPPEALLRSGGVAEELKALPRELFGSGEVLGRLHQYFCEPYRGKITAGLKNSRRLSASETAAFTQIFTPEWVVKYMVQNSLCSYLREHGFRIALPGHGDYFLDSPAEDCGRLKPEEITLIDPCMGSGNVLLYAFDVFLELYRSCGYPDNIAAERILRCNLFGLELDGAVCAIAQTALRLKAAACGALAAPQVCSFAAAEDIPGGNILGSLLSADKLSGERGSSAEIAELLRRKYSVVVTNPPYLGSSAMNEELYSFVRENYREYGADLFSVFVARCLEMTAEGGYLGFLTPATWLFIRSYEELRRLIYSKCSLRTLLHFEYSAFEDATVPLCAFTLKNADEHFRGIYLRLTDFKGGMDIQEQKVLEAAASDSCGYRYTADTADFLRIPSAPAAYWLGDSMLRAFGGAPLGTVVPVREGLITGDNERFLRRWFEVGADKTAFFCSPDKKWYLINKGGGYRKWYGDREFVVNWENDGREIKSFRGENGRLRSRPQNLEYNFRPSVSWSQITSGAFSVRYFDENFMFNVAGTSAFPCDEQELLRLLGLLCSKAASELSKAINPTMNMNPGDIARLPLPDLPEDCREAEELVRENIRLCREDWDSFETSFDFRRHPLV